MLHVYGEMLCVKIRIWLGLVFELGLVLVRFHISHHYTVTPIQIVSNSWCNMEQFVDGCFATACRDVV